MGLKRRVEGWRETDKRLFAYQNDKKRSTAQESIVHKPNDQIGALTGAHIPKVIAPTIRAEHHNTADVHFIVSEPANQTNMQGKSTPETSDTNQSGETAQQLTLPLFPTSTCSVQDFLARLSHLLASGEDSKILEAHSSLRSAESLGLKDLGFYSLKMSKDSSRMTKGKPFLPLKRWMKETGRYPPVYKQGNGEDKESN